MKNIFLYNHDEHGFNGYKKFVKRAKEKPLARIVKMADIADNTDVARFHFDKDEKKQKYKFKRLKKYINAYLYLSDEITEEEYNKEKP